jgi:RNA polymerase sigma-70 factor (ECF subfamily)
MAADAPNDEQLVARLQRHDLSAFELLMRRHNQRLYRAVRSVLRCKECEVQDAMQDAYLAAMRHIDQFEGRAKFGTWLVKIGINQARARLRRPARLLAFNDLPSNENQDGADVAADVQTPEQQAESHEMVSIAEAAIDRLPDDYRQVFVLRILQGLDTMEAAEVLGLTETVVRQRLHRAKQMLQRSLQRVSNIHGLSPDSLRRHRCGAR